MRSVPLLLQFAALAFGQSSTAADSEGSTIIEGTRTISNDEFSGTPSYISYTTTRTGSISSTDGVDSASSNSTRTATGAFPTLLVGTNVANASITGTATSAAPRPTNTQPCNGYVEFCNRKYSNVSMVAAHNSPFVQPNNVASNQDWGVFSQLSDGVRMLQGQVHNLNGELHYCHTSCDLLDAGPVEEYLTNVTEWVRNHPFEVVTVLIGNGDFTAVEEFEGPIERSGLKNFIYTPDKIPMALDDWPTFGELILTGKRVVMFMDYMANQGSVPYILDQFSQVWETPFSPTDPTFPCNPERPPDLSDDDARNRMYLTNHNLNVDIAVAGLNILVPNTVDIDNTNSDKLDTIGNLGRNVDNCTTQWDRPPNFLIVDYYNRGNFNGSVFAAAAAANGVQYDVEAANCCGQDEDANAARMLLPSMSMLMAAFVTLVILGA